MRHIVRLFALIVAAGSTLPALALDPTGVWEPANRESRYAIDYCGEAGQQLCAQLTWIREDVQDERNTRYLNQYMFRNARQVEPDVWRGTVTLEGFNLGGTLTQTSETTMQVQACALFVLCETIDLTRVE